MTLEELNTLKKEANECEWVASQAKSLSTKLADIRKGEKPLTAAYKEMGNWDNKLKSAIEAVIDECGIDLLRIAEMRQDAFARLKSEQAKQKFAAIAAALGENNGSTL